MKFNNRILALLLALMIACTSIVGCNMIQDNGGETSQSTPTNVTPKPDDNPDDKPDDIPDIDFSTDPYENMSKEEFYASYRPAVCYQDSVYRTKHSFMSGSIESQDQAPTVAENQPRENGMLVRNTSAVYEDDGNTYVVYEADGDVAFKVYKGGGYVTLEEVAAYVYAFGDIPANYTGKKSGSPASSPWGEYLRLNHSSFSGSTSKYPYEPALPRISGCGGDLYYYEIDIGTTGTDCDPSYVARIYNDGQTITRGAARIVYTRYDKNHNNVIDPNEKFVFYTYNHYNDFQEYLNYEGGWGEIFGNVTGGGKISSKYDCNPTPYIQVARRDFTVKGQTLSTFYVFDQRATESILSSLFAKNAA